MSTSLSPLEAPSSSDEVLPEGWVLCESKSNPGKKYYFDRRSGSSLWTKPALDQDKSKVKTQKCKKPKEQPSPTKCTHRHYDATPKQTFKRKSECFDKGNASWKRTRQEDERIQDHSPSPSCSSSGATGTPKTYTHESRRKGQTFFSPQTDANGREGHKISPVERVDRSVQCKDHKQHIPKTAIKDISSPTAIELANSNCNHGGNDYSDIKWSPSQFFEANKLICSLQAQLAEERGAEREKKKDTYAAIEEGITKQSVEYSSKNHPATPPHFRHASQIVSTIKSRLNENISVSEKKPRFSTPANDRLAALRSSLTPKESVKSNQTQLTEQRPVLFENKASILPNKQIIEHVQAPLPQRPVLCYRHMSAEAMDIEQEMRDRVTSCSSNATSIDKHPVDNLVLVVDTNIFIHDIQFIKLVLNSYITGYKDKPTLIVPWQVINELDRMKDNNNGNKSSCSQAKIATDYLYQVLPNSNRIKGQTLRDASNHIYPCELPDDEILNCCLQQSQRGNAVILLSNDKNLCTRATINSIRAMDVKELKDLLRAETDHCRDSDLWEILKYYEGCIYQLLANVLENEMRARYNTLWQHVLFKAPPWSLLDVLQCLIKHWIAVFSEVFPRIEPLIQQLKTVLTRINDKVSGSHITSHEVAGFKDLAYELASKCQIIPEYMELAKLTMQRLNNDQSKSNLSSLTAGPEDEEKVVVDAFENIWTAFSSYCAKLASMLGINHQLVDRTDNNESPDKIRTKWSEYSSHIQSITYALKRTLTANENSGIEPLLTTLLECLALIGGNGCSIDNDSLRTFCLNNRNMIHEALVKFSQLTDLLSHCRSAFKD